MSFLEWFGNKRPVVERLPPEKPTGTLVERLRANYGHVIYLCSVRRADGTEALYDPLYREAADRIEFLESRVKTLEECVKDAQDADWWDAKIAAESKQLKAGANKNEPTTPDVDFLDGSTGDDIGHHPV